MKPQFKILYHNFCIKLCTKIMLWFHRQGAKHYRALQPVSPMDIWHKEAQGAKPIKRPSSIVDPAGVVHSVH